MRPILERDPGFAAFLSDTPDDDEVRFETLRRSEMTGRPAGDADFISTVERALGRIVTARAGGRPSPSGPSR